MYAKDLINNDGKKVKYYFARNGRQISVNVYEDCFVIMQQFGENKAVKYPLKNLEKALERLNKGSKLLETIKYD